MEENKEEVLESEENTTEEDTSEGVDIPVTDGNTAEEADSSESAETPIEEEADSKENTEEKADDSKKKFLKKKKSKQDEMVAELSDKLKRNLAEFENFRKRTEKEKSQMYDMGARSMLEKILPVVDNFERGLDGLDESQEDPFADGMKMVYKQLMTALEQAGVSEIEALGCEFDPEIHNAVMHVDDEEYGENEIIEVMQKGYKYHDTVVRHSMVKVAN